jgi:hypothetical protein
MASKRFLERGQGYNTLQNMGNKSDAVYIRLTSEDLKRLIYIAKEHSWESYQFVQSLIVRNRNAGK